VGEERYYFNELPREAQEKIANDYYGFNDWWDKEYYDGYFAELMMNQFGEGSFPDTNVYWEQSRIGAPLIAYVEADIIFVNNDIVYFIENYGLEKQAGIINHALFGGAKQDVLAELRSGKFTTIEVEKLIPQPRRIMYKIHVPLLKLLKAGSRDYATIGSAEWKDNSHLQRIELELDLKPSSLHSRKFSSITDEKYIEDMTWVDVNYYCGEDKNQIRYEPKYSEKIEQDLIAVALDNWFSENIAPLIWKAVQDILRKVTEMANADRDYNESLEGRIEFLLNNDENEYDKAGNLL
jgi:hypothetical protein